MNWWDEEVQCAEEMFAGVPQVRLPEVGPCCMCGKSERRYCCFRCDRPVCAPLSKHLTDSSCGGVISDWLGIASSCVQYYVGYRNQFWCRDCLEKEFG